VASAAEIQWCCGLPELDGDV